jgi:hypothetical protein
MISGLRMQALLPFLGSGFMVRGSELRVQAPMLPATALARNDGLVGEVGRKKRAPPRDDGAPFLRFLLQGPIG